jgi:repressor LexA
MLTRKQHELLTFIDRYLRDTGFSPSFDEMKDALNLRSKSGIHRLISALEERGFLSRRHHRARALEVLRLPDSAPRGKPATRADEAQTPGFAEEQNAFEAAVPVAGRNGVITNVIKGDFHPRLAGVRAAAEAAAVQLPLYGRIAAGLPIEALRDTGASVEVPLALLGSGDHYALEVAGDSMIEAGILDGDTVIIRREETAENGQIIVALIDGSEVTLKRMRRRGNAIALEPANARYETRIVPVDRVSVQGRLVGLLRSY